MKQPILSIIIPAYNAEHTLRGCVGSIIAQQGFENYEVIIINDGSTDFTKHIAQDFQARYKNIKCINQKNTGVSVARNRGINMARGKYITFVDSDDKVGARALDFDKYPVRHSYREDNLEYTEKLVPQLKYIKQTFDSKYFSRMIDAAENKSVDVVLASKITVIDEKDSCKFKSHLYITNKTFDSEQANKKIILEHADARESANFAIYNNTFLKKHDLKFEENMPLDEDMLFCMLAVLKADNVATITDSTYFYNRHEDSLSYIINPIIADIKFNVARIQRFSALMIELSKYPEYDKIYRYWLNTFAKLTRPEHYKQHFPAKKCIKCDKPVCTGCTTKKHNERLFNKNVQLFLYDKQH